MTLEAVGIASNVTGLINLGFAMCHELWTYYGPTMEFGKMRRVT